MSKSKHCRKCSKTKRLSSFSNDNGRLDGKNPYCKLCVQAYHKQHYKLNRDRILASSKKKYKEGTGLYWRAKLGSTSLATEFAVKYDKNPNCYFCNKFLSATEANIDHLIPRSRGGAHSIENLVVICADCNHLKHTRTDSEFWEFLGEYLTRFFGDEAEPTIERSWDRERLSELAPVTGDAIVCSHGKNNHEKLAEMSSSVEYINE